MPYYDSSKSLTIQIRDRMRDLIEGDPDALRAGPTPLIIRSLPSDDVPEFEQVRISLSLFATERAIDIEGRNGTNRANPRLVLTVQQFADNAPDFNQSVAQDKCITVTDRLIQVILKYQSDPTPGQECRLWDEMRFLPQTTVYRKLPGKFWASDSLFQLDSYQRN